MSKRSTTSGIAAPVNSMMSQPACGTALMVMPLSGILPQASTPTWISFIRWVITASTLRSAARSILGTPYKDGSSCLSEHIRSRSATHRRDRRSNIRLGSDAERWTSIHSNIKNRMVKVGRKPDHMKVHTGCLGVVEDTDEEAHHKRLLLDSKVHHETAIASLSIAL